MDGQVCSFEGYESCVLNSMMKMMMQRRFDEEVEVREMIAGNRYS